MFSDRVADLVTARGVDCRAVCTDAVLASADDETVLQCAVDEGRVLVTNNVVDSEPLRRRRLADGVAVPPCIYTADDSFPRNRRFVGRLADALVAAAGEHLAEAGGGVHWLTATRGRRS